MAVPENILTFARQLRKEQTDAESLLWRILRGRRFAGFKFRRQHPLAGYILDFYCRDAALVIELDGGGHNKAEQHLYDEERSRVLAGAGITVIRFWNNDVLNSLQDVLGEIHMYLHRVEKAPSSALRAPSPLGRRIQQGNKKEV